MPTRSPGLDSYLGRHRLWNAIHTRLIGGSQRFLYPLLRGRDGGAIEPRDYLAVLTPDDTFVRIPDVAIIPQHQEQHPTPAATLVVAEAVIEPLVGELPVPEEIHERYLE